MAIVINGSGTVTGLAVGGLPDGTVDAGTLATNSVDSAELIDGAIDASHMASGFTGKVVQVVNVQDGAVATGTTTMVADNSIPQNTEGNEFMTLAVTPTNASNNLRIDVSCIVSVPVAAQWLSVALFQDSTANALSGILEIYAHTNNDVGSFHLTHWMAAGTTSATTFKVRAGTSAAGTVTFNGRSGSQYFAGVMASSITITEYEG